MFDIICLSGVRFDAQGRPEGCTGWRDVQSESVGPGPTPTRTLHPSSLSPRALTRRLRFRG